MHIVSKVSSILRTSPAEKANLSFELYPLPFTKYITIYNEQSVPSNSYDYFNDVIFDIKDILKKNGIEIIQFVNSQNERKFINCHHISKFSYSQMNYLIKNSLLHICTDSYTNEVCGALDIPSICILGNRFAEHSKPWYNRENGKHHIAWALNKIKPSFSLYEHPKSINLIKTEQISKKILEILSLGGFSDYETLFTGPKYHENTVFDLIPNFEVKEWNFPAHECFIRFDKFYNEKNCLGICSKIPFAIVTNRRVSKEFLSITKGKLRKVIFLIDEDSKPEDVSFFIKNGIDTEMYYANNLINRSLSYKFLDFGRISVVKYELDKKTRDSMHGKSFRSSKIIVSENKQFPSYSHLEKGIEIAIINKVINTKSFWIDESRFKIFGEK